MNCGGLLRHGLSQGIHVSYEMWTCRQDLHCHKPVMLMSSCQMSVLASGTCAWWVLVPDTLCKYKYWFQIATSTCGTCVVNPNRKSDYIIDLHAHRNLVVYHKMRHWCFCGISENLKYIWCYLIHCLSTCLLIHMAKLHVAPLSHPHLETCHSLAHHLCFGHPSPSVFMHSLCPQLVCRGEGTWGRCGST